MLIEAGWVKLMGRRKTPGRPVTYGTTDEFLVHFGIESIKDLPGLKELKAAGLLDTVDAALDKMGGMPEQGKSMEDEEDDNQIDLEEAIAKSEREAAEKIKQERELHDEQLEEEELQAAPSVEEEKNAVEEPQETTQLGLLL